MWPQKEPHHSLLLRLQAYDQHLNMILGEVEETITTVEIDDETYEEIIKVRPFFRCSWGLWAPPLCEGAFVS